ncbi:hypothetical protein CWI38_0021p0180 [Hamiltosporidium tvaerminnensis]|uniref:Uncharacterized protein n=1 Tax=Hamiltosporidium tvaerminnensis TaxID=1176355 RepID=A0A4Q9M4X7_9MICR|nr:hypothetical protein LUQ84_000476 [Hamiltosporidium tvaerminnensis]TBU05449.1 hypothetical protein CWI37_0011p0010 [Hamiltosporidium tvaerminnensis]TBU20812.1 hypothetical protein CWI38_0021p0180 [Hamiltosporidium tvaerminnensis]
MRKDEEYCLHKELVNGICVECGIILTENNFNYEFDYNTMAPKSNIKKQWKYSVKIDDYEEITQIEQILTPLEKLEYKNEVLEILKTKKFKSRIGKIDKIVCIIYFILKRDCFPISTTDLAKFSKKNKKFLLKNVFKEFPFIKISPEYLKNLFKRFINEIERKGFDLNKITDEYSTMLNDLIQIVESNTHKNIHELIMAFILYQIEENNEIELFSVILPVEIYKKFKNKFLDFYEKNNQKSTFLTKTNTFNKITQRVDKACAKLKGKDIFYDKKIDMIDIIIEKLLIQGYNPDVLKTYTTRKLKSLSIKSDKKT